MEKKQRSQRKFIFNFVDVILIAVIIGAAAALVFIFYSNGTIGKKDSTTEITYKIQVRNMREEFKNLVSVGDSVIEAGGISTIGEVTDVAYEDAEYIGLNRTSNELTYGTYPGYLDMTLTIRASADISSGYYVVNGYEIGVGSLIYFRVPEYTAAGYCTVITAQ